MAIPYISRAQVEKWLTQEELFPLLKRAFLDKNTPLVQMPPKPYLFFPQEKGDLRIMPCFWERVKLAAVKIVNAHPCNPEKFGLPSVQAYLFLYNPETGFPFCYMDGSYLTAVRTAALAALAADFLARKESSIAGILGAGVQACHQTEGLFLVRPLKEVRVWSKDKKPLEKYLAYFKKKKIKINIRVCATPQEACESADILVTCTPARQPLVKSAWVKEGTHINAIGADAPFKEELDPEILKRGKIIVDEWEQAKHAGEINVPVRKGYLSYQDIAGEIADVLAGKIRRKSKREITIFDSTGLALQDVAAAYLVFTKAKASGFFKDRKRA